MHNIPVDLLPATHTTMPLPIWIAIENRKRKTANGKPKRHLCTFFRQRKSITPSHLHKRPVHFFLYVARIPNEIVMREFCVKLKQGINDISVSITSKGTFRKVCTDWCVTRNTTGPFILCNCHQKKSCLYFFLLRFYYICFILKISTGKKKIVLTKAS